MNDLYEIALHTVVLTCFCWILMLTVIGAISIVKDFIKLIRGYGKKKHRKPTEKQNDGI